MIALDLHPRPRRVAALIVLLAYAMPLMVGAASDLGHGASHLLEQLQERQAKAAALGLVHAGEGGAFTHTHGGVAHSHVGAVDALLAASEQAGDEHDAAAPILKLPTHAPAAMVGLWMASAVRSASTAVDLIGPEHPRPLPPLPPPRA